jgi:glycerophosphoryl diester phosphodiesterase
MTAIRPLDPAAPGLGVVRAGHATMFKWHRGRRRADDVPFTAARILEGLRLGASVEIDLRAHADGGFAVLHDDTLDRETTGAGPCAAAGSAALRGLRLRAADGSASAAPVLVLEDLFAALAGADLPATALLQLDLKEDLGAIAGIDLAAFAAAARPLAPHLILSGGDAAAVARLAAAVPDAPGAAPLRVGFDPCHDDSFADLEASGAFDAFIADGLAAMPSAATIYLEWRIVRLAAARGVDLVGRCHAAGKTVDAWTLDVDAPDAAAVLATLLALKVDQITTDDPVRLEAIALTL